MDDRLLTAEELAGYLSVPKSWVWAAARTGRVPCLRVGRYQRFRLAEVVEALEQVARQTAETGDGHV